MFTCPICDKPMIEHCRSAACTWVKCQPCGVELDVRDGHWAQYERTPPKEKK